MSNDIYIPMQIVLRHPAQFRFETALNSDIESARELVRSDEPHSIDWEELESQMKPVLMCKFGARETWRVVEVFDHDLHVTVGGAFRLWLIEWLELHGHPFTHI